MNKKLLFLTCIILGFIMIFLAGCSSEKGKIETSEPKPLVITDELIFSGFKVEMNGVKFALDDVLGKLKESISGEEIEITDAQLINYIARGGENLVSGDMVLEDVILSKEEAERIPCTPIDRDYGKKNLAFKKRKVPTFSSEDGVVVSYFVTPKGNVFCWPPMEYEGKSYVNANVTVKSSGDTDIFDLNATNPDEMPRITFDNGETILISNKKPNEGENIWSSASEVTNETISVWYDTEKNELDPVTKGVASGFIFE